MIKAFIIALALSCSTPVDNPDDTYLSQEIQDICVKYGEEYRICPELLMAIIERESTGDPLAENGSCKGLMQVSEKWHQDRMAKLGVTDLFDIDGNIHVGTDYLSELFEKYEDVGVVLDVYNGNTEAFSNSMANILSPYTKSILNRSEALERVHEKVVSDMAIVKRAKNYSLEANIEITELYKQGRYDEIKKKYGITRKAAHSVYYRNRYRYDDIWKPEDINLLCERIKSYYPEEIAKELNKTIKSVVAKLTELGLSKMDEAKIITVTDACSLLGCSRNRVLTTLVSEGLKIYELNSAYCMSYMRLINLMQEKPHLFDIRKMDQRHFEKYSWYKKWLDDDREMNRKVAKVKKSNVRIYPPKPQFDDACTERCKKCIYHNYVTGFLDNATFCDYLCITGERRGCKAGDECTRYQEGKKKRAVKLY